VFQVRNQRSAPSALLIFLVVFLGSVSPFTRTASSQPSPAWHTQTTIYQVFVQKFTPSQTLKGVEKELDYLEDLGVGTIWLMPIFEAMDEHGYNTTDYYKIASRYGTEQDLRDLVKAAHGRGMRILLDLVINHTGTLHPWFSSSDPTKRKDHWYIWADKDLQWNDPWKHDPNPSATSANQTWFKDPFDGYDRNGDGDPHNDDYYYSVFGNETAECHDASGQIVGYGGTMPDLNYNDTTAKNEITAEVKKIMEYWLKNTQIDGFRCDAARYLSEYGPGNQADQKRTHKIWRDLRAWLDTNHPAAVLLAEAPTETYAQMRGYYGTGNEFHCAFHFMFQGELMTPPKHGYRSNAFLSGLYEIQSHLPVNTQDVVFLSNHDQFTGDRVASQLGEDVAKIKLAASLYLLLSGNPSIYYGEEIGMTGGGDDAGVRKPLDWSIVRPQAFEESSILNHYRRLLKLRKEYDALRGGITCFAHAHYSGDDWWDNNPSEGSKILAIVREWFGEKILVVHNFSNSDQRIHVSLDSTGLSIPDGTSAFSLMGTAPAYAVSSSNRNWYDLGTIHPKCSQVVLLGDISKYQDAKGRFVAYENALQDGRNPVTVHYREDHPSPVHCVHAWDDNGLVGNNKVPMTYEGQCDGGHWWSVTMSRMPDNFEFCFVDEQNNWDGIKRKYHKQGAEIFVVAGSATVSTSRP
jgi:alpha-amylase